MQRLVRKLTAATFVAHVPIGGALGWHLAGGWGLPLGILVAMAVAAIIRDPMARVLADRPLSRWRRLLVEEPYLVHWVAVMLSPVLWPAVGAVLFAMDPPSVLGGIAATILVSYLTLLPLSAWAVFWRRRRAQVKHYDVPIDGLPTAFEGYRVVHLSDLHLGSMTPRCLVERWVEQANALRGDLIVLTGDYVTSGTAFHRDIASALGSLRARNGVLATMGNHDYYGDGQPLMSYLEAEGIALLRNASIVVEREGEGLTVVGLDDVYTERFDADRAFAEAGPRPRLVLAHDPNRFAELRAYGVDLVLGGHSHWGQVGVPFVAERINALRLIHPELVGTSGWTTCDGTRQYVHPGLGTTGLPVRFGVAPQIVVHRLVAASRH